MKRIKTKLTNYTGKVVEHIGDSAITATLQVGAEPIRLFPGEFQPADIKIEYAFCNTNEAMCILKDLLLFFSGVDDSIVPNAIKNYAEELGMVDTVDGQQVIHLQHKMKQS